jgi:hypothetical protein
MLNFVSKFIGKEETVMRTAVMLDVKDRQADH